MDPAHETQLQVPDGPLIGLPAGKVAGSGDLTVQALPANVASKISEGARGWSIALARTTLTGKARLAFPVAEDQPDPFVGYTDAEGKLVPVQGQRQGDFYVVETDHFSNWFAETWDWLLQKARSGLDALYAPAAQGKQPNCTDEVKVRAAGLKVSSDDGSRVLWCLGTDPKATARLKVTNARGYAVTAEYTPGMSLVAKPSLLEWMPSLSKVLDRATKKENKLTLIAPGETIEFTLAGSPQHQGVMVQPSVPAYLASAFWYSVDTVTSLNGWAGGKVTNVQKRVDLALCTADFISGRESIPGNAWEAQEYLNDSLGLAFGCVQEQLKAETAGNWVLGRVIDVVSWLWSGIQTALNGFGAAADTALNPSGYRVLIDVGEKRPVAQVVLGEGGGVTVNGTRYGREGPNDLKALTAVLGPPDQSQEKGACRVEVSATVARWGDLQVTILNADFADEASPATWNAGGVAGWRLDPSLDARDGLAFPVTGPKDVSIGTPLATVKQRYQADDIFSMWMDGPKKLTVFAGDTTDASFTFDASDKVAAMSSGWEC